MNESEKYVKNIATLSQINGNAPTQYNNRQHQYMKERSTIFASERAYLSSDFVSAKVQGITDNFYEYVDTHIRLSDVTTSNQTSLTSKKQDDFKEILLPECNIDYLPIGAKIETMGSVWIAINPSNISSVLTTSIIARCNASFNIYDDYGNIITEPIIVERTSMLGNDNKSPLNLEIMQGYFNVTCQLNSITEKLSENSRIILGKKAYHITGYTDFIQEFSGDYDSCHICTFSVRVEEPTELDDIPNRIADGLQNHFEITAGKYTDMIVGGTQKLSVFFTNNEKVVENAEFLWETSDNDTVSIDENGNVMALSVGNAQIVAKLRQNTAFYVTYNIDVAEIEQTNKIEFLGDIDNKIIQYQKRKYEAGYFENGEITENEIEYTFSGADRDSYSVTKDGNKIEIECIFSSKTPLYITAKYGDYGNSITIELSAY